VTQRSLATKLGIALGLTNIYLKRLARKGYIKCVSVQSNRISYLITPGGIAEKARLTYEFMNYSLHLYGEVRQHLREVLQECAAADRRVAIYGRGEAAELAYLSLKECGLEPGRVTALVRQGGIYHEILEEAKAYNADLIVMSSHRPAMRSYFLGSNAGHVVRYATCSVLVVRR